MVKKQYYMVVLNEEAADIIGFDDLNKNHAEELGLTDYMEDIVIEELDYGLYFVGKIKTDCSIDEIEELDSVEKLVKWNFY